MPDAFGQPVFRQLDFAAVHACRAVFTILPLPK
jgi:hypothetical protein